MLRGLLMTMTLCLTGAMCAPTQAAQVVFAGQISQAGKSPGAYSYATNVLASMNVGFVPAAAAIANATNGFLKVGADVFQLSLTPGDTTVTVDSNGAFEKVTVDFVGGAAVAGKTINFGSFSWTSTVPTGLNIGQNKTLNWQAIYDAAANPKNGVSGSFNLTDTGVGKSLSQNFNFSGAAVPEPGSIALLGGLGLVFGAVRRRRQTRATAV